MTSQLSEADRRYQDVLQRCHEAERQADKAELLSLFRNHNRSPYNRPHTPRHSSSGRYRQKIHYSDGGRATRWYPDEDGYSDMAGLNDSPGTRRFTYPDDSPVRTSSKDLPVSSTDIGTLPPRMRQPTGDSLGKGKNSAD